MKKILLLLLTSFVLTFYVKATSLPGTHFKIYDSVTSAGDWNIINNLQTGESWQAPKSLCAIYADNNVVTVSAQGWPSKAVLKYGYDSILNGVGANFADALALQNYLRPHKLQQFTNPAQDSTGSIYATGVYDIYGWDFYNPNSVTEFVKIYDAGTVITSTSTPKRVLPVAANGFFHNGFAPAEIHVNSGIVIRVTNAAGYTDVTRPASTLYISIRARGAN